MTNCAAHVFQRSHRTVLAFVCAGRRKSFSWSQFSGGENVPLDVYPPRKYLPSYHYLNVIASTILNPNPVVISNDNPIISKFRFEWWYDRGKCLKGKVQRDVRIPFSDARCPVDLPIR